MANPNPLPHVIPFHFGADVPNAKGVRDIPFEVRTQQNGGSFSVEDAPLAIRLVDLGGIKTFKDEHGNVQEPEFVFAESSQLSISASPVNIALYSVIGILSRDPTFKGYRFQESPYCAVRCRKEIPDFRLQFWAPKGQNDKTRLYPVEPFAGSFSVIRRD